MRRVQHAATCSAMVHPWCTAGPPQFPQTPTHAAAFIAPATHPTHVAVAESLCAHVFAESPKAGVALAGRDCARSDKDQGVPFILQDLAFGGKWEGV